jgi:hypothetical protein
MRDVRRASCVVEMHRKTKRIKEHLYTFYLNQVYFNRGVIFKGNLQRQPTRKLLNTRGLMSVRPPLPCPGDQRKKRVATRIKKQESRSMANGGKQGRDGPKAASRDARIDSRAWGHGILSSVTRLAWLTVDQDKDAGYRVPGKW